MEDAVLITTLNPREGRRISFGQGPFRSLANRGRDAVELAAGGLRVAELNEAVGDRNSQTQAYTLHLQSQGSNEGCSSRLHAAGAL